MTRLGMLTPSSNTALVTLWACLIAAGVDPSVIRGSNGLFANQHQPHAEPIMAGRG